MAETTVGTVTPSPRKGRRWLRALLWALGIFLVLVVVVYLVGTSAFFLKRAILPKVGKQLNSRVTVADASISPFKEVVLRDLKVQPNGKEMLLTAPEVRLRYSLMAIIRGNMKVDLVSVTEPAITLVEAPDGSSNLDPVLKGMEEGDKKAKKKEEKETSDKPLQIDLNRLVITNATLRRTKNYGAGKSDVAELTGLNATLENVKNGQPGKLTVNANVAIANDPPAPGASGRLRARLDGGYTFALTPDLKPASVEGQVKVQVSETAGSLATLAASSLTLDAQVLPTEIRQVALRLAQSGKPLAELLVSGPFNASTTEGQLSVRLQNVDSQLLNLAGAPYGIDFGPTRIASSNLVQIAKAGAEISTIGELTVRQFQVTRTNQTTPPMDLGANYNLTYSRAGSNALVLVKTLNVLGTQKNINFLKGELTKPMPIAIGDTNAAGIGDATFRLDLTRFDLADWKPFIGEIAPAGVAKGVLQVISERGGNLIRFDVDSQIDGLVVVQDTNRVSDLFVGLKARGHATNMQEFVVPEYRFDIEHQKKEILRAAGSARYDSVRTNADAQVNAQLMLANASRLMPQPDLQVTSGISEVRAKVQQRQSATAVSGTLELAEFSGRMGTNAWQNLGTKADLDLQMANETVDLRRMDGELLQGTNSGGTYSLSGNYGLTNKTGRFRAKLAGMNEKFLGPFLQGALADKQLVTIAINGTADAVFAGTNNAGIKADVQVTKLVVKDSVTQQTLPALEAGLSADASLSNNIANVAKVQLVLSPTELARTNAIQFSGTVDMTDTNGYQGSLKLASETLDLTRYYDLFIGTNAAAQQASTPSAPPGTISAPAAQPEVVKEPEPTKLPFKNFIAGVNMGRFYLRELVITNLVATTTLNGPKVKVQPIGLALNGARVEGTLDLDLGVRGFKYGLEFSAVQVPYAPLVNTFAPERRGEIGGTLTAVGNFSGQGITDPSLQRNLRGKFDVGTTNLNLAVQSLRSPLFKTIINVIAIVPELIKNPGSAVGSLANALFGSAKNGAAPAGGGTGGGWADELRQSPIDVIQARGEINPGPSGENRVNLEHSMIQSPVFQAYARGTVTLAPALSNSVLNLPLAVSIRRSLAEKISLVPPGTPTNAAFVKLPEYVTITGTVGDPQQKINAKALLGTALQQFGGKIPGVDEKTGSLIQGLGGLLNKPKTAGANTNAPAGTNPPASGAGGLLQGLGGLLGAPNTNAAGTNAPATTNRPSAGSLLNDLLNPRKK